MYNVHDKLESMTGKIDRRYDPEHDAGAVTWIDADLRQALLELAAEIDSLNRRIIQLEQHAHDHAILESV